MSKEVIILNNVSKKFLLPEKKRKRSTAFLKSFWDQGEFLALDKITLNIEEGKCIGLLGKNGAGKTLLLEIIAGIVYPTFGVVEVKKPVYPLLRGKVILSSDLSGLDNIFVIASLLGIRKKEVEKRIDSIADISELSQFLDLPVRCYSAGMSTRLYFSLITLLGSDILLLDEGLSFSDQPFIKKSCEKIKKLKDGGTTILFTSHSFDLLNSLCDRGVVLDQGKIVYKDEIHSAINYYKENILFNHN